MIAFYPLLNGRIAIVAVNWIPYTSRPLDHNPSAVNSAIEVQIIIGRESSWPWMYQIPTSNAVDGSSWATCGPICNHLPAPEDQANIYLLEGRIVLNWQL